MPDSLSLDYSQIPVLDWSLYKRDRAAFLIQLRRATINVGFLYLCNHGVPDELVQRVKEMTINFFALPQSVKDTIDMANSPHFHGYLSVGGEDGHPDTREQFNFGADRECRYKDGEPVYLKLQGNALWPTEAEFPGFKDTMLDYYSRLKELSWNFVAAVSESLGLAPEALHSLFSNDPKLLQPRAKLMRYPADLPGLALSTGAQSLRRLGYRTAHSGNLRHQPGTGFGTGYTEGRGCDCFFSSLAPTVRVSDMKFEFPREVLDLKRARQERTGESQEFHYSDEDKRVAGEAVLSEKIKMHPLAALRFYPELCDGLPGHLRDERYPAIREHHYMHRAGALHVWTSSGLQYIRSKSQTLKHRHHLREEEVPC